RIADGARPGQARLADGLCAGRVLPSPSFSLARCRGTPAPAGAQPRVGGLAAPAAGLGAARNAGRLARGACAARGLAPRHLGAARLALGDGASATGVAVGPRDVAGRACRRGAAGAARWGPASLTLGRACRPGPTAGVGAGWQTPTHRAARL